VVLWVGLTALISCQQTGSTGGPPPPLIGTLPEATRHDRVVLSGTKASGTAIVVDGFQRVPRDGQTLWATMVDLPSEGENTFILHAMDDLGNLSETVTVTLSRDTVHPDPPTVSAPAVSPANPVALSGTKEANTFIRLNGRRITEASADETWTYEATLRYNQIIPGVNTFTLTAVDAAGNESDPVSVVVTLTTFCEEPPQPVFPLDNASIRWGRAFSWTQQVPTGSYVFDLSVSPAFDTFVLEAEPILVTTQFVPPGPPPPIGAYYWRVGAVDPVCGTSYGLTRKVIVGGATGDVTGDGFADVIVGVWADDQAGDDAGAAYLYKGGAIRDVSVDTVILGQNSGDGFGSSVAKAGDLDRDGFEELLVGAMWADRNRDVDDDSGAAYLYWGGSAPATAPTLILRGETDRSHMGNSVAGVGDVNGDGYPDIAIGAYQTAVAAACDGGTRTLAGVGRVYILFGGPRDRLDAVPDVVLTGETAQIAGDSTSPCREGDEFGFQVAGGGDVNGDGYDDLVVGARGFDTSVDPPAGVNSGRMYLFFGGPWVIGVGAEQADVIRTGASAGDEFGTAVAGVGDTDGDGFADLLVGAPLRDLGGIDSGSVSRYLGRSTGVSAPIEINGIAGNDNFGAVLSPLGDVNGDGFSDFVVGAYLAGPDDNGAASYFIGPTATKLGTIVGQTDLSEPGDPLDGDWFGSAVVGPGDVDGDGFDDSVVGGYRHDACLNNPLFCDDAGRAYVIIGPAIADRVAAGDPRDWLLTGFNPGDNLGSSLR
jgi:hypothetical protein